MFVLGVDERLCDFWVPHPLALLLTGHRAQARKAFTDCCLIHSEGEGRVQWQPVGAALPLSPQAPLFLSQTAVPARL